MNSLFSFDYYLLRIPALPVDAAFDFNKSKNRAEKINNNNFVNNAIFLASQDFHKELKKSLIGGTSNLDVRIIKSLYKYYVRISTRCTPFGLFAGCALGEIKDSSSIVFSEDKNNQLSRLDMHYAATLSDFFNRQHEINVQLKYCPNDTLYRVGDSYRYVEFKYRDKKREYFISSIRSNELLEEVVFKSPKAFYLIELKSAIIKKGISPEHAERFISDLIDSQIILSELQPNVTGHEFFKNMNFLISELKGTEAIVSDLNEAQEIIDSESWNPENSHKLKTILNKYVPTDSKDLIQTDLFFNLDENQLDKAIFEEILQTIEKVAYISNPHVSSSMEKFIKRFESRYEEHEVPLLLALDAEVGVGYGNNIPGECEYLPLIDSVDVPKKLIDRSFSMSKHESEFFESIYETILNKEMVFNLNLNDSLFKKEDESVRLPGSMYLFGSLLAESPEKLDKGDFHFYASTIAGPSAGALLGRFCHGDPKLALLVKETLKDEENHRKEAIFAEIVHLPEARVGNVIMRPTLRDFEIPILTNSSVDQDHQIPLKDLMVSVRNGKVHLRSKKLNKEVIPRLTNAHNYSRGLPYYRFLCDLQNQGNNSLDLWTWSFFDKHPFLPRIQCGKVIFKRARWLLKKSGMTRFLKNDPNGNAKEYLKQLMSKERIINLVIIAEGDNELFIDLDSDIGVEILADTLKKRDVILKEYLFHPKNCFIKDKKGSYANEIILPLVTGSISHNNRSKNNFTDTKINKAKQKRSFSTGEEWLYYKIYTGNKTADKILTEAIKPLAESFLIDGLIEKWFFIRYFENGEHLRIRFHHSKNPQFWKEVIDNVNTCLEPYREKGMIYKIQLDTYQRELERYGHRTIELSETLFFYDTIAISEFLDLIEGDQGEEYRWLFALLNIDMLLDDFGLSLYEKFQLISQLKEYFYEETNRGAASKKLWVSLNNKYRLFTKDIYQIIENNVYKKDDVSEAVDCFKRRSERIRGISEEIRFILNDKNNSEVSLSSFLSSHIHMTLNRTFIAKQRIHETVIYHFLAKFYDSKISRQKKKSEKYAEIIGKY